MRCACLWVGVLLLSAALSVTSGSAKGGEDAAARAYLAGELGKAEKVLDAEIAAGGARHSRYLFLGRVCFRLQSWEKAQRTLEALLKKDAENPQGRELLGRVLFRRGRFKAALPYYEESLRQASRAELRLELGEVLIGLGRKTDALIQLRKVTEDSRAWPRAHYLLGSLRLESGLGHWAARQLWIAQRLGYKPKDLHLKLARAFFLEGRLTGPLFLAGPLKDKKAGTRTEKYILVRPAPMAGKGFWFAAGVDTALYQVETAVATSGGTVSDSLRLLAARCWLAAGNLDNAAGYARVIKGGAPEVFDVRAEILLRRSDLEAFEKLFGDWPVKKRPAPQSSVRFLVRAALVAQFKADLPAALRLLEAADRLMPGRSEVLRPMIDVLARMRRRKEAVKKARLLVELHPDSPAVRLVAGRYGIDFEAVNKQGAPVLKEVRR